mgnify:FL=1
MTKEEFIKLDDDDPLRSFRDEFYIPEDTIYFDGNSLGMAPKETQSRMAKVIENEWGQGLIRSWMDNDWGIAGQRIGNKIAYLIGANEGEVIAADSTSVNIFKLIAAAIECNPGRETILTTEDNFPTDLYMMQGLENFSPEKIKAKVVPEKQLLNKLDDSVAALLLTEVNYKTGEIADMAGITQKAHEKGILVIWDLSHSAGSIPVNLNDCSVDFAVGCGYKFLNGGPGAPAFLFVAKRHQEKIKPILSGWMGHEDPFSFVNKYTPAKGINRFLCGTPPVLGLIALECGVDIVIKANIDALREKTMNMGSIFIDLMESQCGEFGFELASPRDDKMRAGQVSFKHPSGFAVNQALVENGIVGDFRVPDIIRFGIAPLYTRYQDIYDAVENIKRIMKEELWRKSDQDAMTFTQAFRK